MKKIELTKPGEPLLTDEEWAALKSVCGKPPEKPAEKPTEKTP